MDEKESFLPVVFYQNNFYQMITLVQGDITRQNVEAIVNAANTRLAGGGGVDGAIHKAGGPTIAQQCQEIIKLQGRCPTGQAVITNGGNLKAKYIIHTVGPIWHGGQYKRRNIIVPGLPEQPFSC